MEYEPFLRLVKGRRSIRQFRSDPVSDEDIKKILEAARWAPSGANTQPWEFIVIKNKKWKNEFLDSISEMVNVSGLRNVPVLIVVCGDTRKRVLYPSGRFLVDIDKIRSNEVQIEFTDHILVSSLANAFLNILYAAHTLGLGTRYITATSWSKVQPVIKQKLRIPEYLIIYDTIALGYPLQKPGPKQLRPLEEVIHMNTFDQSKAPKTEDIIIEANRLRERLKKRQPQ
jgi:nitroreductase